MPDNKTKKQRGEAGGGQDRELPQPPDGGYGWVVVFAAFMINVIVGIVYYYGVFNGEFNMTLQVLYDSGPELTFMVGLLLSAMPLLTGPLASFLINRYDSRCVTIVGALIATIGFITAPFSPSVGVLILTFGAMGGFGFGMMCLPAVISVCFYFEKRLALMTAIVFSGMRVGNVLFAPLFQALMSLNGWMDAMLVMAAITLQGAVFGALLRPLQAPPPKPKKSSPIVRENNLIYRSNEGIRGRQSSISDAPHHISADPHLQSVREAKEEALRKEEKDDEVKDVFGNGEKEEMSLHHVDDEKQSQPLQQQHGSQLLRRPSSIMASSMASLPVVVHGSFVNISRGNNSSVYQSDSGQKQSFLQKTGLNMLADPLFLIPIVANLVATLGHYIPFFFIVPRSVHILECTKAQAALLMYIVAVTNTLGGVLVGFLADFKSVNALLLHNIAIASSGVACILSMFCVNYASTCVFIAYFGLCMVTWSSLSPKILCELLGLEKLPISFGLLCAARGISSLAGPPFAGMVYYVTKNYNNTFHVDGILLIIGGSICFLLHLPYFQRKTYANRMLAQQKQDLNDNIG